MADSFQKLGVDRMSQNLMRAISSPGGTLSTGDITKGTVVSVSTTATETTGSATVSARRTGAILLSAELASNTGYWWSITGTKLTVSLETAKVTSFKFWVF